MILYELCEKWIAGYDQRAIHSGLFLAVGTSCPSVIPFYRKSVFSREKEILFSILSLHLIGYIMSYQVHSVCLS